MTSQHCSDKLVTARKHNSAVAMLSDIANRLQRDDIDEKSANLHLDMPEYVPLAEILAYVMVHHSRFEACYMPSALINDAA